MESPAHDTGYDNTIKMFLVVGLLFETCCVPSGLDFENASDSTVCCCLSDYLLRGHRVTLLVKCRNTQRSTRPLFAKIVKWLRQLALFHQTTVVVYSYKLNSNILFLIWSGNEPMHGKPCL